MVSVALHAGIATASLVALPRAPAELENVVIVPVTLVTATAPRPVPVEPVPAPEPEPSVPVAAPEPIPDLAPEVDSVPTAVSGEIAPDPSQTSTEQNLAQQRLVSRFESILKSVEKLQNDDTAPRPDLFDSIPSEPETDPRILPDATDAGIIDDPEEMVEESFGSAHLQSLVKLRIERDCWRDPSDMADAARLSARISFVLTRDGDLGGQPRLLSPGSVSGDASLRVFVQRAFRAIRACAPYDFLPPERYGEWRRIVISFSGAPK